MPSSERTPVGQTEEICIEIQNGKRGLLIHRRSIPRDRGGRSAAVDFRWRRAGDIGQFNESRGSHLRLIGACGKKRGRQIQLDLNQKADHVASGNAGFPDAAGARGVSVPHRASRAERPESHRRCHRRVPEDHPPVRSGAETLFAAVRLNSLSDTDIRLSKPDSEVCEAGEARSYALLRWP